MITFRRPSATGVRPRRARTLFLAAVSVAALAISLVLPGTGAAHGDNSTVAVVNPLLAGGDPNAVSGYWPWGAGVAPAQHHIVYGHWGYPNDWSMDLFARVSGRAIVTPFGSTTSTGHPVRSRVVGLRLGCASGVYADGGYVVTIEATDQTTGAVLGRVDVMHVASPQVAVGAVLGPWTTIGYTSRFRYSSCYQVTSDWGIHVHIEVINHHRYACWQAYGYEQALTAHSRIGVVASHNYGTQRARC